MARVLIAGCGYVGTALGKLLSADGHEVFALRRSVRGLPAGVTAIQADLTQQDGEWVDETSPAEPRHFSGARLLEGETLLLGSGVPATVVRLAGIYGPGRVRLVERVRRGETTIPVGAPIYSNRIHRDDCAGVLRHLISLDRAEPLYLAADDEPAEMAAVLRWLAERLGVPLTRVEERAEPRERYGRASNKRVKNARLLASGYRFRYPTFREGYAALIAGGAAAGE